MRSVFKLFIPKLVFSIVLGRQTLVSAKDSNLKLSEFPAQLNKTFLQYNLIPEFFDGVLLTETLHLDGLSFQCRNNIEAWLKEIRNNLDNLPHTEPWALQMIDAWGKPLEGLLSGHIAAMGDFDECIGVRYPTSQNSTFKGQYCINYADQYSTQNTTDLESQNERSIQNLLDISRRLKDTDTPVSPTIASCLPSSCSKEDIQIFVQTVFELSGFLNYPTLETGSCYTDEKPNLSIGSIIMIVILGVFAILIIISSAMDILNRYGCFNYHKSGYSTRILLAFSLPKNVEAILSTECPPGTIGCLNGMRFLSACWIVLGHTYYNSYSQASWNLWDIIEAPASNNLALLVSIGTVLVVDTFLTITSALLTLSIFKTLDKSNGNLNFSMLCIHRYIRLTPIYAILIGLTATLYPYASTGPKWSTVDKMSAFCRKNWWKNLLYINNLPIYNSSEPGSDDVMCLGHTWYLAVDMQLYIFSSLLIIFPLWRWKRVGKIILTISTLISIAIPIIVTYSLNLIPASLPFRPKGDFDFQGYMATWMRASPFMMGIWTGYFLYKTRRHIILIPKVVMISCWVVVISSGLAVIFGIQQYFDVKYDIPRVEGMCYAGFHHAVWGVCIGWIIFACARGYGGWVNRFLSWKVFIPLGRLTFAIYLVHLPLEYIFHLRYRQPIYYSLYNEVHLAVAHLFMACLVAFVCSVTIELPFLEMSRILLTKNNNMEELMRTNDVNNVKVRHRNYGTATPKSLI